MVDELVQPYAGIRIDKVAGVEARGFILGGAVAPQLSVGFIPVRKQVKLPWETIGEDYQLEYGSDRVEIHKDAVQPGAQVLLVDDLMATGGTAEATIQLIRQAGGDCFLKINPNSIINFVAIIIRGGARISTTGDSNHQSSRSRISYPRHFQFAITGLNR